MAKAHEHRKSSTTVALDAVRILTVLAVSAYIVAILWKWNWWAAILAAIPVVMVVLNAIGFATLPLYTATQENRLRARAYRAFQRGDLELGNKLTAEFEQRFQVKP